MNNTKYSLARGDDLLSRLSVFCFNAATGEYGDETPSDVVPTTPTCGEEAGLLTKKALGEPRLCRNERNSAFLAKGRGVKEDGVVGVLPP